MKMKMNHIEIKATGEIFYSNSLNVLVGMVGTEVTGIATQSLRNYFSTNKTDLYENDNCIIRRGPYFPMQKPNVSAASKARSKRKKNLL